MAVFPNNITRHKLNVRVIIAPTFCFTAGTNCLKNNLAIAKDDVLKRMLLLNYLKLLLLGKKVELPAKQPPFFMPGLTGDGAIPQADDAVAVSG